MGDGVMGDAHGRVWHPPVIVVAGLGEAGCVVLLNGLMEQWAGAGLATARNGKKVRGTR